MHRVVGLRKGTAQPGHRRPLVGRDDEIARLEEAAAAVREGEGRILTLVAEAGLGKTRLIDELRLREPDLQWYEAHARSYGGSTPFLLFRDHLLAWCGAREGDAPEAVRAKLLTAVAEVVPEDTAAAMPVVELVAGLAGDAPAPAGEELRREIVRVVGLLARRQAARGPMVVTFDDLQWSDAASADLIGELLAISDEAPVLLLLSFRPDRASPAWRIRQRIDTDYHHRQTEIALGPLSPADAGRLLEELLSGSALAPRVRDAILAKAEGNPLFIEQFARAVLAGEVGGSDVALPDTLVSLLASRLDRLAERTRQVLQAASVIGRTFAQPLLHTIAQANGALDRDLVELQRADLIREDQRVPERVFSFRHPLLQEVAYSSLLQRRRRELHLSLAEALELGAADRADERAALVGHHFAEAGDARAVPHLRDAARRALRLHALEDALDLCDRAIAVARKTGTHTRELCDVYHDRGRALELRADYDGALATYDEMEKVGTERKDRAMVLRALSYRITVYATPNVRGDLAKARELIDVAIPEARELGDRAVLAQLLWSAMHAYAWSHQEEQAVEAGDEALAIARELGLKEIEAYVSLDVSRYARFRTGWDDQLRKVSRAKGLFAELGNQPMLADTLSTLAIGETCLGLYDEALRSSADALALAERIDNLWNRSFSRFATPFIRFDRGDWGLAITEWEDAVRLGREAGFLGIQGAAADLAWVLQCAGNGERADSVLRDARELTSRRLDAAQWVTWIDGVRARIHVDRGELDAAAAIIEQGQTTKTGAVLATGLAAMSCAAAELALARGTPDVAVEAATAASALLDKFGYVPMSDETRWLEGEAHRRAGRLDAARASFAQARSISDGLRATRTLWRIQLSLGQIADAVGDAATAARLRDEAATVVRGIAASLEVAGLSERFVARPEVQALFGLAHSRG